MAWIWRKETSLGKKVLAALLLVSSAPFLVPPLVVASTIAFISSLACCFYLVSYVCTEKLMRKLLPATAFGEKMVLREEEGTNIVFDVFEDMRKESKSLLDSIRDDDRTNQSLDREKDIREDESITNKSDEAGAGVGDLSRKKKVSGTIHEGGLLESTTKEASRGKDMEESSNESSLASMASAQTTVQLEMCGMEVLYSEEQIWAKMETLRKIVGYNVERSTTYLEELKALHMFMGVEFPTSMLDKNIEQQVSERLCFLMSLIGIK